MHRPHPACRVLCPCRPNLTPQGEYKENAPGHSQAGFGSEDVSGHVKNNYVRPEGQNVGNFLTGRSSSRVLAPPGGHTNITFG